MRLSILTLLILVLGTLGCGGSGGGGSSGGSSQTLAVAGAAQEDPVDPGAAPAAGAPVAGPIVPGPGGIDGETSFDQTVYPLLTQYCLNCHSGGGPGFPDIAHPDLGTAYRAVVDNQKVNFAIPINSRLVQRLITDRHFCWNDCPLDGAEVQTAIEQWAQLIVGPNGDPTNPGGQAISTGGAGQVMADGTISSAVQTLAAAAQADSGRYNGNIIAYWDFKSEQGDTAYDKAPIGPLMDLTLEGATWISGGGLEFAAGGRAIADETTSRKLWERIASGSGSGQYSVEAWLTPANTSQEGPARIITYSQGTGNRNFMLGQVLYTYRFRNRSLAMGISQNGTPELATADGDEDLQATLQHVVITFDRVDGRRVYVDGTWTDDIDEQGPESLATWNPDYDFVLGNETSNNRPWDGQIRLVAIYDKALNPTQIMQNYQAGAFDKFLLRFGLDTLLVAGSYIQFEVSEFDPYSYLFCFPTLVSSDTSGYNVKGVKIAVNGIAPVQSQSFRRAQAQVDSAPTLVSNMCSVVPKDLGSSLDSFSIYFEELGSYQNIVVEAPPVIPVDNSVAAAMPDIGIRNFEQVNDTMAELTGVDPNTPSVRDAFDELREQLPATNDVRTFVSAHQVAVAKLSLEYCDTLVESVPLRTAFWGGGFDFTADVTVALAGQAERDLITIPLVTKMLGTGVSNQPTMAEVQPELDALIMNLTTGCTPTTCDAVRTRTVVKAVCSAVLSSAPVTLE